MAAPRCPICETPYPAGAAQCPTCGADLTKVSGGVDALLAELDALESDAEGALVEELESLMEIAPDVANAPAAYADEELAAFLRRVERAASRRAGQPRAAPSPPPSPSPLAAPTLAVSALLYAAGLFLLPSSVPMAAFALLSAVALTAVGVWFRLAAGSPQK